jgi:hypothetical protein
MTVKPKKPKLSELRMKVAKAEITRGSATVVGFFPYDFTNSTNQ